MRYLLFALALIGTISAATMTYADPGNGGTPNRAGGEGATTGGDPDCGAGNLTGKVTPVGDEC
jgi:hypothetical protein